MKTKKTDTDNLADMANSNNMVFPSLPSGSPKIEAALFERFPHCKTVVMHNNEIEKTEFKPARNPYDFWRDMTIIAFVFGVGFGGCAMGVMFANAVIEAVKWLVSR